MICKFMKIYHRYLLGQWLRHFALSFCVINVLLLIGNLVRYGSDVGVFAILPLLPFMLPSMLVYCLPISSLMATISTIMRARQAIEPVTLASSGISIFQMMPPIIAMGLVLSIVLGTCFEWVQPMAEKFRVDYLSSMASRLMEDELHKEHATIELKDQTIYVFNSPAGKSVVFQDKLDGHIKSELFAENCELKVDHDARTINIKMQKARVLDFSKEIQDQGGHPAHKGQEQDKQPFNAPTLNEVSLKPIPIPDKIGIKSSFREQSLSSMWAALHQPQDEMDKLESYFHEKICMLFSCLLLMLAAFPLAFSGAANSRVMGFLSALGMIFLLYYPLMVVAKKMVLAGNEPAWMLMEMPNLILALIASAGLVRLNFKV